MTIEEQIKCAKRELAMRQGVYPKWVASGKMKQEKADHEIEAMEAIVDTLTKFKAGMNGISNFAEALEELGKDLDLAMD